MSNQYENPQAGQNRPLPKREQDLFKSVVKHFETKQYKKGIKAAESILKKFPKHGETMCMKGLILNTMAYSPSSGNNAANKGGSTAKERKEEAVNMVKMGLMNDMRSHVCWHVYGLIHRSDRNYNEAIKAYKQALRIDAENLQILRDLSLLQIQMRDLSGFCVTRHSILTLKPNQKINWLTFALAKHLVDDWKGAVSVIDIYLGTLKDSSEENKQQETKDDNEDETLLLPPDLIRNYESSELALFRNSLLASSGDYSEALKHLDECKHLIVDNLSWSKAKGKYQLQLKLFQDAQETFLNLLKRGYSEDYTIHSGYMLSLIECNDAKFCEEALEEINSQSSSSGNSTAGSNGRRRRRKGPDTPATMKPLSKEERQILLRAYKDLRDGDDKLLAKSHAVRRIPLTILQHDDITNDYPVKNSKEEEDETTMSSEATEWQKLLSKYIQTNISRGVPSLASDLFSLLLVENEQTGRYETIVEPMDVKVHPIWCFIVKLVDGYIESLELSSQFTKISISENGNEEEIQPPSTLLWAWYLRANLHLFVNEHNAALTITSKCLEHTPTAVDVYELRGRIIHSAGDINGAADCLDEGRKLDKQDRFLNNLATKYMLKSGREDEALSLIGMFTRHESDPEQNIFDMQCIWYELELAACYSKKGEWGKSFKKYVAVEKHFEDFHEDQFDFHSYCIRKVTLRSYVDVLHWEDTLFGNKYYTIAAEGIIKNYLYIYDHPDELQKVKNGGMMNSSDPDYSKMTPSERKKAKAQARKKKKAAEKKANKEAEERRMKLEQESKEKQKNSKKKKSGRENNNGKQTKNGGAQNSNSNNNNSQNNSGGGGGSTKPAAKPKDEDPDGKELLSKDPLEEAKKYTATLVKNAPNCFSTWICQYDVSIRRGKLLMALQALYKAKTIDANNSELFTRIVAFQQKKFVSSSESSSASILQHVFESERLKLLNGKSTVSEYVADVASNVKKDRQKACLALRLAVAKATVDLNSDDGCSFIETAVSIITGEALQINGVTLEICKESLSYLKKLLDIMTEKEDKVGSGSGGVAAKLTNAVEVWRDLVYEYFPQAKFE